ncbi:MAG: hypothetical protein ACFFBU_10060 [Promethearchaeota archaeon]
MKPELDTTKTGKKQHFIPNTENVLPWIFLIVPGTIILLYNCGTTLFANLAYIPPTFYEVRIIPCIGREGAERVILYQMFVLYPQQLFVATIRSLFLGGVAGALSGMLVATFLSSNRRHSPVLGAFVGGISGMALATTIVPSPERLYLTNTAAHFFDLYAHGGIDTIQIGCQYGAYPYALMHYSYLPILLLFILVAINSTLNETLRLIQNSKQHPVLWSS